MHIVQENLICNTSSDIKLQCFILNGNIDQWKNIWIHTRNGFSIRPLHGTINSNLSTIVISYCDYMDDGEYTCQWSSESGNHSDTIYIEVYGL